MINVPKVQNYLKINFFIADCKTIQKLIFKAVWTRNFGHVAKFTQRSVHNRGEKTRESVLFSHIDYDKGDAVPTECFWELWNSDPKDAVRRLGFPPPPVW